MFRQGNPRPLPSSHLGGSELVPHEDVGDEDGDADDNRQSSPQVHTGRIQVLDDPESPQLLRAVGLYSVPQSLLPPEELDDSNATQQLCHELETGTREWGEVETALTHLCFAAGRGLRLAEGSGSRSPSPVHPCAVASPDCWP